MLDIHFGLFRVLLVPPNAIAVMVERFRHPTPGRKIKVLTVQLLGDEGDKIHLVGLDDAGISDAFTEVPTWTVDDPTVATVSPNAAGDVCDVLAATPAKAGTATVTASYKGLSVQVTVNVVAGAISHLEATADAPFKRPA